ncbi:MAG: alpha/beta fold hydrolase [Gammaproteobacteria bacterium]
MTRDPTAATRIKNLEIALPGGRFDVAVAGPTDGTVVLLLHGFPQTRHTWRDVLPALAKAGFRAVAPDQRGYSPGARPEGVDAYHTDALVGDALALADQLGVRRFHLVGHDWGGQLAWLLAGRHRNRVRSLAVLSRPHPTAFLNAMRADPAQAHRSRHHRAFLEPDTADRLLADDARGLRALFGAETIPADAMAAYVARLQEPGALNAALNWYRAAARAGAPVAPAIHVPTLYLWGTEDATVGRAAAEGTAAWVEAPYRFIEIPGAGHFLTDDSGPAVVRGLLAFLD